MKILFLALVLLITPISVNAMYGSEGVTRIAPIETNIDGELSYENYEEVEVGFRLLNEPINFDEIQFETGETSFRYVFFASLGVLGFIVSQMFALVSLRGAHKKIVEIENTVEEIKKSNNTE